MHDAGPPEREAPGRRPPSDVAQALARAREHARSSVSEAVAAVHALLDAAALAASGLPADASELLAPLARGLEGLSAALAPDAGAVSAPLLDAFAEALDAEIARWEQRARDDAEARAVLRAFLGVRELLWEMGLRRSERAASAPTAAPGSGAAPRAPQAVRRRARVQRVPVQG
jgi:hypothetical protein